MNNSKFIVGYSPRFAKKYKSFEKNLRSEVKEKIELLKDAKNHKYLKVHKLHGVLRGCYSFSVNYKIRAVFEYISKEKILLLGVGDHDVYKK